MFIGFQCNLTWDMEVTVSYKEYSNHHFQDHILFIEDHFYHKYMIEYNSMELIPSLD